MSGWMTVQGQPVSIGDAQKVQRWIERELAMRGEVHCVTVADRSWISVGLPHSTTREVARRLIYSMGKLGILRHTTDGRWRRVNSDNSPSR